MSKLQHNEKAGGAVDFCIRFGGIIWPQPQRRLHVYERLWHGPLGSSTGLLLLFCNNVGVIPQSSLTSERENENSVDHAEQLM